MNRLVALPDATASSVTTASLTIAGLGTVALPAIIARAGDTAARRYVEFFTARIRNRNTREAYGRAATNFLAWSDSLGMELATIEPVHVAAWIEAQAQDGTPAPTIKQRLAAVRALFDALVVGQAMRLNPAAAVRGPSHSAKVGKTPVLDAEDARRLLDAIDISTSAGLRDRALIGLMVYSFARIGAATAMRVEDVYERQRRLWVRLHEKGGKRHEMPCHHNLEAWLHAYIDGCGLAGQPKGGLFRTIGRGTGQLSDTPLTRQDARAMVRRRADAAGIGTKIGNHTFRATGITSFLKNGGTLERAAQMANHSSTRITQLYDRRHDEMSLDDVERIGI